MTGEKEFRELAANSEAFELMVKYELGIYRGYDSYRGEFTKCAKSLGVQAEDG